MPELIVLGFMALLGFVYYQWLHRPIRKKEDGYENLRNKPANA